MRQDGFVLATVMLMLTVMSVLVLANMRWVILYHKRYMDLHRYQRYMLQFEDSAYALAKQFDAFIDPACYMHKHHLVSLEAEIRQHGCRYASNGHYIVEEIGLYPCVRFTPMLSTQHWLLSVMDDRLPHRVLQFRIATPVPVQLCEKNQIVMIERNILSQRLWFVG